MDIKHGWMDGWMDNGFFEKILQKDFFKKGIA